MKKIYYILIFLLFIIAGCSPKPIKNITAKSPEELFNKIQTLGKNFDASLASLYSDEAIIENKRTYPTGQEKVMKLTGKQYKALIKKVMPLAKARGDISTYSDIKFEKNDDTVKVTATRYSELKKYKSPYECILKKGKNGNWLIIKELSVSKP